MTLDDLAALEKEATKKAWFCPVSDNGARESQWREYFACGPAGYSKEQAEKDAAFIAAIRNAAPILIEVARAAKVYKTIKDKYSGRAVRDAFDELREALTRLEGVGK